MITDKDVEKLKEVFVTKDEIKDLIDELKIELKSDIANSKDIIVKRLDIIDQELIVSNGYGDQLEDHETRIATLEKSSKSS